MASPLPGGGLEGAKGQRKFSYKESPFPLPGEGFGEGASLPFGVCIKKIRIRIMKKTIALVLLGMATLRMPAFSQNHTLVVKAAQPTATIEPTMWGVFFEDINLGADGGIYAELVKNRSFEFFKP